MGVHPGLRPQLVAKQLESPDCNRPAIDGPTFLITVVVDNAFRARSVVQWHGFCQGPPTGTSPADGIDSVTSTYYYYVADRSCSGRDSATMFSAGQGGEAGPIADGHACCRRANTSAGHGIASVPLKDEGRMNGGCPCCKPNCPVHSIGQGPYACSEAQLMANSHVIHLDEEGAIEKLLRWSAATLEATALWVAAICGGKDRDV
uniref:Predicted protein n=1 Tax=Hordeum vulgare subsp. vulgare TaxID=112509 RepID=F2EBW1_HORVV|nr:predicted protein [Hordeum vulgare subsp. vulgare]